MSSYTVEKEKDGPNFVIVDDEGVQQDQVFGTRRAAIRALGYMNKWRDEDDKRRGHPQVPEPKKPKSEEDTDDED